MGIKLNGCNFGSCGQIKDVSLCNKILPFRSTNYPLKSLFREMNRIFKKSKRYERDCSPWKHISQRATKHEKRSIQSLLDHHRWTSLHEMKRKEVNHYYIVILKCCCVLYKERKGRCVCGKCGKVYRSFPEFRCLFQWII